MNFGYDLLPQRYAVNFPDRNFSTTFFEVKFQNDGEKKNVRTVQLSARDVVVATQSHILENNVCSLIIYQHLSLSATKVPPVGSR